MHTNSVELGRCKICGDKRLNFFAHTAKCRSCGVVLNYPYTLPRENDFVTRKLDATEHQKVQRFWMNWYVQSGERNHHNFTHMAQFALSEGDRTRDLVVLDYGGGGGQFALVMRSMFPRSTIYLVDMATGASTAYKTLVLCPCASRLPRSRATRSALDRSPSGGQQQVKSATVSRRPLSKPSLPQIRQEQIVNRIVWRAEPALADLRQERRAA
jgi:hypothetical protein